MSRQDLRAKGEEMLRTLFGTAAQTPGLGNLLTEAAYGGIWTRPALPCSDRLVCAIAALATGPRLKALRRHIEAGLDHGLTAEAIREMLVQASLYAGFSAAEDTLELAAEVFAARSIPFPADPPEDVSLEELDRRGAALMAGCTAPARHRATQRPATRSPARCIRRPSVTATARSGSGPAWIIAGARWSPLPALPRCVCRSRWRSSANRR